MGLHVALLRAVNVSGTGKLPMAELRTLCELAGFSDVRTYIQSGNVVFRSRLGAAKAASTLQRGLRERHGLDTIVHVRGADALDALLADNPFAQAPTNRVLVFFYASKPSAKEVAAAVETGRAGEQCTAHGTELYVHYPEGQGRSKLRLPRPEEATGRNMNTVAKLAEMARDGG